MGELPPDVSIAEAIGAFQAVEAFWVALSNDDDRTARLLLSPAALAEHGWTPQDLARQVRATLAVTTGQCATMGTSNRVRILAGGELAFWSMPVWHDTLIDAPTLVAGWGWQVEQTSDGSWQLLRMPDSSDLRSAPQFSLPEGTEAEALVAQEQAKLARSRATAPPAVAVQPAEPSPLPAAAAAPQPSVQRDAVAVPVERSSAPDAPPVAVPIERDAAREAIPVAVRVGATRAVARADPLPTAAPRRKSADDEPRARIQVEQAPGQSPAPAVAPPPRAQPARTARPAPNPVQVPANARPVPVERAAGPTPEGPSPSAVRRRAPRARVLGASFLIGFVAAFGIVLTVGLQLLH